MKSNRLLLSITSIILILFIWEISAFFVNADIILPRPIVVLKSLFQIVTHPNFIKKLLYTFSRGLTGFVISFILGIIVGVLAGVFTKFRAFISPVISVIKSTPVISVILLALIWFNVNDVPIFVAFLMAFPIVCGNIIEGVITVNKNLLEMANVYQVKFSDQLIHIFIPSIVPFIIAAASLALGVVWKVIIAAEVLSQPKWAIGTSLNEAKDFLLTEEVFAWTIVAILLSSISEFAFNRLLKKISRRRSGLIT